MPKVLARLFVVAIAVSPAVAACGDADDDAPETQAITAETGIDPGAGSQNFNVALNPPNGDARMGSATITAAAGEQVRVTIQLDRVGRDAFPAEIREGTCDELGGEAAYDLSDVEGGTSETLLEVSMDDLRTTPYAIVVLPPDGAGDTYEACGELLGDATGG